MVKVVSVDVPHKSRVGGVRKVATTDPLYVRLVLERMREEVTLGGFHAPRRTP